MCVHFLCGHLRVDCRFVFDFSSDATVQWGLQVVNYFIWQPAHTAAVVWFACSVLALEMFGHVSYIQNWCEFAFLLLSSLLLYCYLYHHGSYHLLSCSKILQPKASCLMGEKRLL